MNGYAMKTTKAQATKTKQTAAACYAERHAECQDLLKRLSRRLDDHQKDQTQKPADWGYPGDLGRIAEQLAYALAFLGDRSAVDSKGLDY